LPGVTENFVGPAAAHGGVSIPDSCPTVGFSPHNSLTSCAGKVTMKQEPLTAVNSTLTYSTTRRLPAGTGSKSMNTAGSAIWSAGSIRAANPPA
jgi:hypothetical protein